MSATFVIVAAVFTATYALWNERKSLRAEADTLRGALLKLGNEHDRLKARHDNLEQVLKCHLPLLESDLSEENKIIKSRASTFPDWRKPDPYRSSSSYFGGGPKMSMDQIRQNWNPLPPESEAEKKPEDDNDDGSDKKPSSSAE